MNCGTSQFLFLISTANFRPFENFFMKGTSRARKSFTPINAFLLKYPNWKSRGPSFSPKISIVFKKVLNSVSQSFRTFSCVMTCGTLAAKMNPFGVLSYQPRTVLVHLNGVKFCCVVSEIVGGFHALGVKRPFPACRGEGGSPKVNAWLRIHGPHSTARNVGSGQALQFTGSWPSLRPRPQSWGLYLPNVASPAPSSRYHMGEAISGCRLGAQGKQMPGR